MAPLPSGQKHRAVAIALYRGVLRVMRPFTESPLLCSLLYKTGEDDHIDYTQIPRNKPGYSQISSRCSSHEDQDEKSDALTKIRLSKVEARDLTRSYDELRQLHYDRIKFQSEKNFDNQDSASGQTYFSLEDQPISDHLILYKQLLREILGKGVHMNFPLQITSYPDNNVMTRLKNVICREFRCSREDKDRNSLSPPKDDYDAVRRTTAFLALRELEKKLLWAESLGIRVPGIKDDNSMETEKHYEQQKISIKAAKDFKCLLSHPPSFYLRPGSFLIAHPLMVGCFSRAVVCILEHSEPVGKSDIDFASGGTYGIIINKSLTINSNSNKQRDLTLREVIRRDCLPQQIKAVFGNCAVRNGGPVNLSIQMLRSTNVEDEEKIRIGGKVLPMILNDRVDGHSDNTENSSTELPISPALNTGNAVYYGGDITKAAQSVIDDEMKRDNFSFIIGASCWEVGQLESEIARGYWLPCRGPPQTTLEGGWNYYSNDQSDEESDLWYSMMCALGDAEGKLAYAISKEKDLDENGFACDYF